MSKQIQFAVMLLMAVYMRSLLAQPATPVEPQSPAEVSHAKQANEKPVELKEAPSADSKAKPAADSKKPVRTSKLIEWLNKETNEAKARRNTSIRLFE